jgi:formate dehydrogenase iron-sulfur subunit
VPACPFGVLDRRVLPADDRGGRADGRVWKCTLCYDRTREGITPACAQACPTESIQFGPLDELRERAAGRLEKVTADGFAGARLYGEDPDDGVGGFGAFFLLLDEPETYGLPPAPRDSTRDLGGMWRSAAVAGVALLAGLGAAFLAGGEGSRR